MNILQYQRADGLCVYNADHAELRGLVEAQTRGRRLPVSLAEADAAGFSDLAERNPRLAGRHNLCDALLAAAVCREVGAAEQAIRTGLYTYRGMPHRMERSAPIAASVRRQRDRHRTGRNSAGHRAWAGRYIIVEDGSRY
jgi:UDP-N-acetylmuramoylalanine-D-glutamate ligase